MTARVDRISFPTIYSPYGWRGPYAWTGAA